MKRTQSCWDKGWPSWKGCWRTSSWPRSSLLRISFYQIIREVKEISPILYFATSHSMKHWKWKTLWTLAWLFWFLTWTRPVNKNGTFQYFKQCALLQHVLFICATERSKSNRLDMFLSKAKDKKVIFENLNENNYNFRFFLSISSQAAIFATLQPS